MKNIKSKIVVPALGLILLSTAASISGSVAWFTANRTAVVKGGEFAVVKTGEDLDVVLGAGAGTQLPAVAPATPTIETKSNYNLTDASFDHTNTTAPVIVTPNGARNLVQKVTAVTSAGVSEEDMLRDSTTHAYTAFTWTLSFTIHFSTSSTLDTGLFLDLSDQNTYMSEVVEVANGDSTAGLYEEPNLSGSALGNDTTNETGAPKKYYRAPNASGQAFRIAFVPTTVPENSLGITKVWADNDPVTTDTDMGKFVDSAAAGSNLLSPVSYGSETTQFSNGSFAAATGIGNGKVLMKSGDNTAVPTDAAGDLGTTDAGARTNNSNYLGFFKCPANGGDVTMTYTCVAWFEGSHPTISRNTSDFEKMVVGMKFGVADLKAA